jgi:hypothetical protein
MARSNGPQASEVAVADFVAGVGPLFGPDFVVVTVNDETGLQHTLQVYPDAHNPQLKAAGLPTQYYFQPANVYLAKKENSPNDYDFGVTVFKGLATGETTLGITPGTTTGGSVEAGGGFCSFSTTFAIPDSVIANAIQKLKAAEHSQPADRLLRFFNYEPDDPDPRLGIVPITENNVTIEVPQLAQASDGSKNPMFISAQTTGKGSIEMHGRSAFLVTMNELAAGAIVGSLKQGVSPFVIHNLLKESFYISGVTAIVHIDVDKVYDSFSAAVSTGGFFGIDSFAANFAYQNCLTTGGITTEINENGNVVDQKIKDWITQKVDEMRKTAMDLVKQEIFDWDPSKGDTEATADRGWFGSLFGGTSVSLKDKYEHRGIKLDQSITLNESFAVESDVSGDLNDLLPAVKADPDKYIAIAEIFQYFRKIQIAATCAVNFGEVLPDGTDLRDPIRELQLEAGYPDYDAPLGADGKPSLQILGEGFHYTLASTQPNGPVQPVIWTKDNPSDIINLAWLRLDNPIAEWPTDQVFLRRRLIYDGADPRVDLSDAIGMPGGGGLSVQLEDLSTDHAPVLTTAAVGYVFIHFLLDRLLPKPNITVTITPTIGDRSGPPILVTRDNQKNILWEVFSDKYVDETQFSYTLDVEVTGPNFTDDPIRWSLPGPVIVQVPQGRLKYINPLHVLLPAPPQDKVATINDYIKNTPD